MEKGRVGGGLLVATGVIAQMVSQAMGLSIPQPIGYAVLAICVVLVMLGVALVFSPSTVERLAREEVGRTRRVREQLAIFLEEGEHLDRLSRREDPNVIGPQIEAWATTVRDWLTEHLDTGYAKQFLSASGLPMIVVTGQLTAEQRKLAEWMHYRNVRLAEFLQTVR